MNVPDQSIPVVVVGSIALDSIATPRGRCEEVLGGSASYACAAASFFTSPGMVGIVGDDFPEVYKSLFDRLGINQAGLQVVEGKTFRWSGEYEENMDNRRTIRTDLNVFANFTPDLPEVYRGAPYILLGNISPDLQIHVLDQITRPKFVVADTMDLWIELAPDALASMISRVDMLMLNESEARHYTGHHNLLRAAEEILVQGPKYVVVKKGEHGALLVSRNSIFALPAYPVGLVSDPTGAGDSFAGAFIGALAERGDVGEMDIRFALGYGTIVASFAVEWFSLENFNGLQRDAIDKRFAAFREIIRFP